MKPTRSFIAVLLCGLMTVPAGWAQQAAQNSEVIIVPAGDSLLRWFAHEGRTYFIQVSDPNDHLRTWIWSDFIETGNDHQISHEIGATADRAFFRLHYTDEQPPPDVSLEDWDADGDGLSNALELTLQTNPLVADTSGDGISDGWAYFHGLNPLADNAASMFQGGTATNIEAYQAGVQAHPAATLADRDGDLILNEVDADPDERVIDWAPASYPAFAVIELDINDVDDWALNDFTAKGTVLLSRNQGNAPFDRAVIDRNQVAHLFSGGDTPTVGAPLVGYGPTLFGEQVMGFRLVDGYSVESLWDPLTNTFTAWQRPFGYDDSLCDERDDVYVARHWLNLSPGSPSGLRQSPDGALLPGGSVIQSSDCRIEENGNIVSHNGYWRKDPESSTLSSIQSLAVTPSALRSATLVQGSPEKVKWNLVAAHSGLMVAKGGGSFVEASGALKNVPVHGVTKQGWVVDTQQNRIRANGKWHSLASLLGNENYEEVDLLDIMDTGLAIAKTRRPGQPLRLSILLPIEISEIGFGGEKYWELWSDKGFADKVYNAPHWRDTNGDGDPTDEVLDERNYPVAFTRKTEPEITAKFKGSADYGNFGTFKFKATGPDGFYIPETPADFEGGIFTISEVKASELVDKIKYYSAQEVGKEFEVEWSVKIGEGGWSKIGTTKHTVYVVFGDPLKTSYGTYHLQETLFNMGCRNADNLSDNTNNSIVDLIYQEFSTRKVYRVIPSQGIREDQVLHYWKNSDLETLIGDLLATDLRNGNCGSWSWLFTAAIRNQGIEAFQMVVKSNEFDNGEGVMVRNWHFVNPGNSGDQTYPYIIDQEGAVRLAGIPAQGNEVGRGEVFNQHVISMAGNFLYDPSYGTPRIAPLNGNPDIKQYEDTAFHGFYSWTASPEHRLSRINNTSPQHPSEVQFELLPPE